MNDLKNTQTDIVATKFHTYESQVACSNSSAVSLGSSHGSLPPPPIKIPGAARPDATTSPTGLKSAIRSGDDSGPDSLADYLPASLTLSMSIPSAYRRAKFGAIRRGSMGTPRTSPRRNSALPGSIPVCLCKTRLPCMRARGPKAAVHRIHGPPSDRPVACRNVRRDQAPKSLQPCSSQPGKHPSLKHSPSAK